MRKKNSTGTLGAIALTAGTLLGAPAAATAQSVGVAIVGRITAEGAPVPYALVLAKKATVSVVADRDGRFALRGLKPGPHVLVVSAQGYATAEELVTIRGDETVVVDFSLRASPLEMDPITVTGTMKQTRVSESTVKVDVVPAAVLQRIVTNNLMEALPYVNGLYQQVDCGVCYTNSIRINGMEGPYTAVLIDGMPIMSSLASCTG